MKPSVSLGVRTRLHPLLLVSLVVFAHQARADEVDQTVQKYMDAAHVPGLSLTVVQDGHTLRSQAYGYENLETQTKATPDTVFEIGSVTKQFTSTLVLKLVGEGKLALDDPLSKFFDDLPDAIKPVTVRQCLSHTSGLFEYLGLGVNMRNDYEPKEMFELAKKRPLDFTPGQAWSYSNAGYLVAGLIIEKLTKKSWAKNVQETIFKPVGMTSSYIQSVPTIIPNRASGYVWVGKSHRNSEVLRPGSAFAAGAILSTGPDMAKWTVALSQGKFPGVSQAWQPVMLSEGRTYPYGFGWFLGKAWGQPLVQHGGNTYGQSAQISRYPEERLSVIILTNEAGLNLASLADQVAKHYLKHVVVRKFAPLPDPDKARTFKLLDALDDFPAKKLDPDLLGEELRALLGTTRGTPQKFAFKSGFGKLLTLIYLGEDKNGDDTDVYYELVGEKARARFTFLVDKAGRLIRLSKLPE